MSNGTRLAIAIVAFVCALGFIGTAYSAPEAFPNPAGIYVCGGFCLLIAIACLKGKLGTTIRRTLAGVVFIAYCAYLVKEMASPMPVLLAGSRGKPSIVNAAGGFLLLGIPAGIYALFGPRVVEWFEVINRPRRS